MKIGSQVKSKNRKNDYGRIVKIWWDGTIRIKWSCGSHSLCNISDIIIINWEEKGESLVKLRAG